MKPDSRVDAGAPLEVPFRQLLHGWIWLCLIAALGWAATIAWARTMGVGPGTMGMSLAAFLFLWVVMMAAMMFPSVAPMALVWIRSLAAQGKFDLIAKAVELPKEFGVPSGVGGHSLDVVKACEEHGVKTDFYIKTFHSHNYPTTPKPEQIKGPYNEFPGYWCSNPEETTAFMKTVNKPWIAFKTMAAGAIQPQTAFRYSFLHGADFVLAGMFDYEIDEDVKIATEALGRTKERERAWKC